MTLGHCKGNISSHHSTRRFRPRTAWQIAVLAALHPALSFAAEEVWPETVPASAPQTMSQAIQPIGAVAPISGNSSEFDQEPMPPGEGPSPIDRIAIGSESSSSGFWRPEIHAGVTASVVFDDNIFISNQNEVSDTIFVTSARVTLAFGNVESWAARFIDTTDRALAADAELGSDNLIALTYSPTTSVFVDNDSLNSLDHDLAGTARWTFTKLHVAFDGRVRTLSDPDADLGRRADRTVTNLGLAMTYDWSEKTRWQLSGSFIDRNYDQGNDSSEATISGYVLYDLVPKTTVGFGLGAGELDLSGSDAQTYERATLRLQYDSFSKVTFSVAGGAELRSTGDSDETNTFFRAGLDYNPLEGSTISLSAYRGIEPSANAGSQSIERTTLAVSYTQRLFQKLTLATNLEYTQADYSVLNGGVNFGRTDDILTLSMALTCEVTENGFVRLGYTYRQDDSSIEERSFASNNLILSFTALF